MPAVSRSPVEPVANRRIGGFEVERHLGEGGMGVVVRARHVVSGAAVAIKLIAPGHADPARSARRFRDEVRAAARLDHPNVVRIHDFGEQQEGSGPPTPYLVMELCTGGTLDVAGCGDFGRMRAMLLDVLGALAHAHARGVVHRDLKPSNVLLATPGDGRPGLKLIDFGLARVREGVAPGLEVAGTPRYMAPEQFDGRRRETGPVTDLYALGCIAYELASGRPPFRGGSVAELAAAHTSAPPPRLQPRFALPSQLEAWIARLLQKDPNRRFPCAADAAHALIGMSHPCDVTPHIWRPTLGDVEETVTHSATRSRTRVATDETVAGAEASSEESLVSATARTVFVEHAAGLAAPATAATRAPLAPLGIATPPMPPFEVALPPDVSSAIRADEGTEDPLGLGLGVYALRGLPFVGRVAERERLWAALARTRETSSCRGVVIRGSSGIGKSRLVEWLAERSTELGVARTLRATHGASRGPDDGVGAMLARELRLGGLARPALEARLGALADDALAKHEIDVLAEMIAPTTDARRTESAQRHEAVRRLLAALGSRRPVILWLDDAAFDLESLEIARHALAQTEEAQHAVLVVVTASTDGRDARPEARAAMERLASAGEVETIDLAPLPPHEHARFVRRLLRLTPAAASQVATRTAGSPSFAIALIGAWVSAGILEHGLDGFRLREGADTVVPPSLADAWAARFEQLLASESHAARLALELAATCGRVVHVEDWLPACERTGADPRILDRLLASRLARTIGAGGDVEEGRGVRDAPGADFEFEHGLIVEALRSSAERAGRWADHGRVLASVLASDDPRPEQAERRGRLLLQARDAAAFDDLSRAADAAQRRGEIARALELVDLTCDALRVAGAEPADPRWGDAAAIRVATLVRSGALGVAASIVGGFVDDARRFGWSRTLPEALWAQGTVFGQGGDNAACRERMTEAFGAFMANTDLEGAARALRGLVHVERLAGRLDEAEAHLATWLELADQTHDATSAGWAYQAKAALASARGRLDEAATWAARALAEMEAALNLFGTAHCLNTAAEIARRRGEHDAAARHYERSLTLATSAGLHVRHIVRLNLALLWLQQARWSEAEEQLQRCLRTATVVGMRVLDVGARSGLLCCAAASRDEAAWREHVDELDRAAGGELDHETAALVLRAGDIARERGDFARANEAVELATRLGRPGQPGKPA